MLLLFLLSFSVYRFSVLSEGLWLLFVVRSLQPPVCEHQPCERRALLQSTILADKREPEHLRRILDLCGTFEDFAFVHHQSLSQSCKAPPAINEDAS